MIKENGIIEWITSHDTVNDRHEYDFGNGVSVVVVNEYKTAFKLYNGEKKDYFSTDGMKLEEFETILINIAKSCAQLVIN